ncbi:SRPBCC domain-containing protein [uncultured Georgenia sp.]|uniref:SRPBCC domain-containing protein n=1 Tax=uncultured Georgenia sp. TaxID=378209 RepID=UPI00262AFF24|nr:SRPBCC domain-containing protein [uncultured Georgenia sp.]HLV04427.1 SRPBCC domain-containing protein [Actinomycetaceae bacterium]
MTSSTATTVVHTIYIAAPAQRVWDAITQSELTTQWGYGGAVEFDLRPGGAFRNLSTPQMREMGMGETAVEGEVLEVDPPRLLVLAWRPMWQPDPPTTRVTWELTEYPNGQTKVVLRHDVSAAPEQFAEFDGGGDPEGGGGGWPWSLSGLKTLLETGRPMDRP